MDIERLLKPGQTSLDEIQLKLNDELDAKTLNQVDRARDLEKWPLAQLISIFERSNIKNYVQRHQLISHLNQTSFSKQNESMVFGVTGTPGAGKSSLIGALCLDLLEKTPDLRIAILAIDPSSQDSGGALLGDRTRTVFPSDEKRIFFRSQASELDLGGMGKRTFQVTRLLRHFFDLIFIETVGIGQSEIEVSQLADHTLLVMQPLAGDQVQFMKAGIMEVPDTFVINKCDEASLATKSLHLLRSSLKLAKIYVHKNTTEKLKEHDIFLTSATQKTGIEKLSNKILEESAKRRNDRQPDTPNTSGDESDMERYFLEKGIREAYGSFGISLVQQHGQLSDISASQGPKMTFEQQEISCLNAINQHLHNQ